MKIVTVEPFLTDLVSYFGLESSLVGVSRRCTGSEIINALPRVTENLGDKSAGSAFEEHLSREKLNLQNIVRKQISKSRYIIFGQL